MKMTKRERFLIYFLICFLLLTVGLYFFVFPVLGRYADAQDVLSEKQMMEAQMRQEIDRVSTSLNKIEELQTEIEELSQPYDAEKTNEQLDRIITGLLVRHALTPVSLTITTAAWLEVPPFATQELPAAALEGAENTAAPPVENKQKEVYGKLLVSRLSAEATGQRTDLYALVDEANRNPQLRVTGFTAEEQKDDAQAQENDPLLAAIAATRPDLLPPATTAVDGVVKYKITVDFEVLMYEEQAQG